MAFRTSYNPGLGMPNIDLSGVDTVARVAIGTIVKGFDDLLGEGEFIYLPGAASVGAGDMVLYFLDPSGPSTSRIQLGAHANSGLPVAWAVAAVPAGSFGWFQISGCVIANAAAGTAASRAFIGAGNGQVSNTASAGAQVLGARITSSVGTPRAGAVYLTASRPSIQGQIT